VKSLIAHLGVHLGPVRVHGWVALVLVLLVAVVLWRLVRRVMPRRASRYRRWRIRRGWKL
jgi:peptidoglycan/LPS O-acetylase OafA/YrhL